MNTVEQLEAALDSAQRLGYHVRMEDLEGQGGGICELNGRKLLFVDLSLSTHEQLEHAQAALRREAAAELCWSERQAA